jgi:hypothetical protein
MSSIVPKIQRTKAIDEIWIYMPNPPHPPRFGRRRRFRYRYAPRLWPEKNQARCNTRSHSDAELRRIAPDFSQLSYYTCCVYAIDGFELSGIDGKISLKRHGAAGPIAGKRPLPHSRITSPTAGDGSPR